MDEDSSTTRLQELERQLEMKDKLIGEKDKMIGELQARIGKLESSQEANRTSLFERDKDKSTSDKKTLDNVLRKQRQLIEKALNGWYCKEIRLSQKVLTSTHDYSPVTIPGIKALTYGMTATYAWTHEVGKLGAFIYPMQSFACSPVDWPEAELKGSIGEGPDHSNFSDRSSVRILSKFRNFR